MTLKEAKKILKKEGFILSLASKVINQTGAIREFEKPEVCEAIKVANANKWTVGLSPIEWNEREARLKKEYGKNHVKGDFSGNKSIEHFGGPMPGPGEEQPEEKKGIIYPTTSPKADFYYKHVLNEGNPALKEAASQFNDALLDEQAKKIQRLGKEIARLKKIIHKKNMKIEELRKESSIHLRGKVKLFGETVDLSQEICDKNEDLRLSKIREKNLTDVCQKYMKENEKLKKKLADKIVNEIDARALKSAESALAYKDEVIETLDKELAEAKHELSSLKRPFRPDSTEAVVLFANAYAKAERKHLPCTDWKNDGKEVSAVYILENGKKSKIALDFTGDEIIFSRTDPDKPRKDSLYSYKDKQLTEKNEVIADLGNELAATKKELEEKTKLVEIVRNDSKQYCYYGISAEKMIQKMANVIVYGKPVSSEDFKEYRRWANGYRYNPQLSDFIEEEEKKLTAKTLDFNAKCMKAARESINDVFESYAAKYAKSSLDDLKEKAYNSFNAKACKLGLVGSKDGNGLLNQMEGVDVAEEGADQSGIIVLCGTDFVKKFKVNDDFIHDLFEKRHKEIKEFMSVESKQLFEGDGIPTKMEVMEPSRKFKKDK